MRLKLSPRYLASVFHFRVTGKSSTILGVNSVGAGRPHHHKKFSNMADVLQEYREAVKEQVMFEVLFYYKCTFFLVFNCFILKFYNRPMLL